MRVLSVSVTERGREMAGRLPFEATHGDAAGVVRERWASVDAFVLFLATGAAVRIVAPLLDDKRTDPAVVCVDEAGRHVIALTGGHAGGANALARQVADLLGAVPVITTATDAVGIVALDQIPGFVPGGDLAGVTAALLDGRAPLVDRGIDWPCPPGLVAGTGPERVVITDASATSVEPGVAVLHPPSLVLGVGASTGAPPRRVRTLVEETLSEAGLAWASVGLLATVDRRAEDPAITGLGRPVAAFPPARLAQVAVPTPSEVVRAAVGTPSVAEAAALHGAGPGSSLVVTKRKNDVATVAIARRAGPPGHLALVGLGPGSAAHRSPAADRAVRGAEVVIGYGPYVDQATSLLAPHHEVVRSDIGNEVVRAKHALAEAAAGRRVALVCSGDAGIYAMASIVLELAPQEAPGVDVEIVPGVTASTAAAAVLGAPLGHDHAVISLSDLLTPWETIESRLRAAAAADLVVVLYNPRSAGRSWQLDTALDILREARPPGTPVGIVTDAGRTGQQVALTPLAEVDTTAVGMTSCVIVGSTTTILSGGRMVTPRGYHR